MDRQIVYPGAIPLETDLLNTNKNAQFGLGQLIQDMFGQGVTGPFFAGLSCVPNSPAAMNVIVNPGSVYVRAQLDANAYSSLSADSFVTMKQGILKTATTFNTPAPGTSGQSINYLISAAFVEGDTNNVVLPYYNSANPSQAFAGPGNNGTSQATTRQCTVQLTLTAGTPATTGSQTTPATPVGQTALYVITVAFGASSVTAANITNALNAPFLMGFARGMQASAFIGISAVTYQMDVSAFGATLNCTASTPGTWTLPPVSTAFAGARIEIVNISANALTIVRSGTDAILRGPGASLTSISVPSGDVAVFEYNGGVSWMVVGGSVALPGSALFGANLAANGYQKLPSGLILQWGATPTLAAGAGANVAFPIAFPNNCLSVVASGAQSTGSTTAVALNVQFFSKSAFNVYCNGSIAQSPGCFIAIGN